MASTEQENILDDDVEVDSAEQNEIIGIFSDHAYTPNKQFIEPAVFLLFTSYTLFETVLPNAIEIQYCRALLNISEDQCLNMTGVDFEKLQRFTDEFQVFRSAIEVSVTSLILLFAGPWSDVNGRKPLLFNLTLGCAVSYGLYAFVFTKPMLHPFYFLFCSLPLAICGGICTFVLAMYCYACDVTAPENRGVRLGRIHAAVYAGILVGAQLCPKLLPFGYTLIFGVTSALLCMSLFYIYFFLDESIVLSRVELNSPRRNLFNLRHIREIFESCYTKRTPKSRLTFAIVTLVFLFMNTESFGENGVFYLYLQNVLSWGLPEYTNLKSFTVILNGIVVYAGTWLFCYKLKLNDLLILSIAAFTRILSIFVMIFGHQVWHIYFTQLLASGSAMSGSIVKLFLSRLVPKNEFGKISSFLTLTESLCPLFGPLMFNNLYNMTLASFPNAIFYLAAILILAELILLAILVQMYVIKPTTTSS